MFILENVPLASYSTMRLGGTAAFLSDVVNRDDVTEAVAWAEERQLPIIMIGEGSNIVWNDSGFPGLVLVNKIEGFTVSDESDTSAYITAGAGMHWDSFVAQTVDKGLSGVEFLSLVPGTVGATPVQNVGAYGAEVSSSIVTIEAYDTQEHTFVILRGSECDFGYRTSRFKTTDKGRFLITAVTFLLQKTTPTPPFYGALQTYFDQHDITDISAVAIREAVIAIRSAKLPDPAIVANNGSFFANPIISQSAFAQLAADFDNVPHWEVADNMVKVSAAWLIEQAGFKDFHDEATGMATWPSQPLVLINEDAHTTAQLLAFKQKIVYAISTKFNIELEQEPELI